jgi:hypothetical protein
MFRGVLERRSVGNKAGEVALQGALQVSIVLLCDGVMQDITDNV